MEAMHHCMGIRAQVNARGMQGLPVQGLDFAPLGAPLLVPLGLNNNR